MLGYIYENIRTQWALAAIFGGLALVMAMLLTYTAFWRPREYRGGEPMKGLKDFISWWTSFCPWVLTVTIVFGTMVGVGYVIYRIFIPPNW